MGRKSLSFLILLIISSGALLSPVGADQCEDCHTAPNQDGDHIYDGPALEVQAPSLVPTNSSFKFVLSVTHPGTYEIKDLEATLSLPSGLALCGGGSASKTLPDMDTNPQTHALTWDVESGPTEDPYHLSVQVSYEIIYPHSTGGSKDTASYTEDIGHTMTVTDLPFSLTPTSIRAQLDKRQTFTFEMVAHHDIYDIKVQPGLSIKDFTAISPSTIGTLESGGKRTITVTMDPTRVLDHGYIAITWSLCEDGEGTDSTKVPVTVFEEKNGDIGKTKGSGSTYRLIGRALGFVGLAFLMMLVPTGGFFKGLSKRLNKAFGGAKARVKFHCTFSYLLLTITLLHAALLMYGHYKGVMWNGFFLWADQVPGINLGTITLVLMICTGINGIFQKRLCKAMGGKNWKRLHGLLTWAALILVIIHLLWIGTTIGLPFRDALF